MRASVDRLPLLRDVDTLTTGIISFIAFGLSKGGGLYRNAINGQSKK